MISAYDFGRMCIQGTWYTKDLRICEATVFPHWWRKNGHTCALADVEDLFDNQPELLLLGQGTPGLMCADRQLTDFLHNRGIQLIQQPTAEAIVTFNALYQKTGLVAGFHLTC